MFYEPPRALAATVALDRQLADSGPIACLRGSHSLEILPHRPSGVLGASRGLVDLPDTATYPEVVVEVCPPHLCSRLSERIGGNDLAPKFDPIGMLGF